MGTACPLTTLEGQLRAMSGEPSHSGDFVGYWVDRLIYYDFPPWVFMVAYAVFGILVAIVFILAPPRWPRHRTAASASEADYLLTGDARHFEHLYGTWVKGVLVLRPAQYFERRRRA